MSTILRDAENKKEYHLFYPTPENLIDAQPCSRGESGTMLLQPALHFKDDVVLYGRDAFRGLLKNIFPEEEWSDFEVLLFLSEAAEEVYGGFLGVMKDILMETRVMVGASYFEQGKIIREVVPVPGERHLTAEAEDIHLPWRDKEGIKWIRAAALKSCSCPIVLLPMEPKGRKAWVRFDKDSTFMSRSKDSLLKLPRVGRTAVQRPIVDDEQFESCFSDEIILLQKLRTELFV